MASKSEILFQTAQRYMPGGVNSPVRAFKAVGGKPLFIDRGCGSKIYDVDSREYIDYVCSWGALILGHSHPAVLEAVINTCKKGTSFGTPTELEIELARLIVEAMPSIEMIRMVNSGTEAVMSVIRLARAYTNRPKIIKFEGCYHGHSDSLLVKTGSGAATLGIPDSLGVLPNLAKHTINLPYNDLEMVKEVIKRDAELIAAIIVEPVAGNMGVIPPNKCFLEGLREITSANNILLIFDEVITGFRIAYGGAQVFYNIKPDLTCLGKIIGNGFPVGCYGGKREIMEMIAPLGGVYQAGTLSGNPVAMIAGITTLKILSQPDVYKELEEKSAILEKGLKEAAFSKGEGISFNRVGSMFTAFFTQKEVIDYKSACQSNITSYAYYFHNMLKQGIYLAPSQFEAGFVSLAHTLEDIAVTIQAMQQGS